ncbi:MAG: glucose-1-phosphate cytidylyltransferase [Planctomycetaceae bacterium]
MKVVLLAGGRGTRLAEETGVRPKPMVEIGGKPILWHIMQGYAHHGFDEFYVACGYLGEVIKQYFLDYHRLRGNVSVDLRSGTVDVASSGDEQWQVHLVDTGQDTMTGGRVLRLREELQDSTFMVTYGDGVGNVDLTALLAFHREQGKLATLTAVRPPARYGGLEFDGQSVVQFTEKPQTGEGWINGGFLVLEPGIFDYLQGDSCSLEVDALQRLAADGQLAAYRHPDFWQCMDTIRDKQLLERLWASGEAPWKVWGQPHSGKTQPSRNGVNAKHPIAPNGSSNGVEHPAATQEKAVDGPNSTDVRTAISQPSQVDRRHFWRDRRVFVTGGTGLVGSWLVRRLLELEADVVCLVRDWTPHSALVRNGLISQVTQVRGSIEDQDLMERALNEYEIDSVFHLAAQTIVGTANRNPVSTFKSNIEGTWALLEACRRSPTVKHIVLASSDKAYGTQVKLPYDENTPLEGRHPYDVSKSCADLIAQSYATTYGLPVVVTRCGNFFGGGDLNWNRIVPGTVRSVIRDERPIIRSNGQFVRDYFYVEDGVEAYLMLAEQLSNRPELVGQCFNFSNERPVTVVEIVEQILEAMNSTELQPRILNQASNEIPEQFLCADKARDMLGWQPLWSLEEGLSQTVDWYRDFFVTGDSTCTAGLRVVGGNMSSHG